MVENALTTTPGLTEVTTDLSDRRPLLNIDVDSKKAAKLGFTQGEVGQTVANALNGTKIGTIELEGKNRDIKVRPQDARSASPKQIGALELPVSQLQQQQAVDKATDKLERKGDKLKERGDRLSDAGDALGDRQEDLGDRQKAVGEEQQDEALEAAAEQRGELRKNLAKAEDSVSSTKRQLDRWSAIGRRHRPRPIRRQPQIPVTAAAAGPDPAIPGLAAAGRPAPSRRRPGRGSGQGPGEAARRRAGAGRQVG